MMRATQLLREELQWINQGFHAAIDDMTDEEWTARPFPGMNLPGFTLWHVARTQDADVQTSIRGVPEVITRTRWASCGTLTTPGFGYMVTLEEADAIARGVSRADVSAYADAVLAEVLAWLDTLSDNDLDAIPDRRTHAAPFPVYANVLDLPDAPIWDELLSTCGFHCRGHLTEVALIKQQVRQGVDPASAAAPSRAGTPAASPELATAATAGQSAGAKRGRWPWGRK
jgi:hypothetical protein